MPKMKTKKAFKSRFKVTGTGKLRRTRPGKRHIMSKKTSKRKRQLKNFEFVTDAQAKMFKRCMGA